MEREPNGMTRMHFDPRSEPWPGTNTIVSQQTIDPVRHTIHYDILEDGTKLARWLTFRRTGFEVVAVSRAAACCASAPSISSACSPASTGILWKTSRWGRCTAMRCGTSRDWRRPGSRDLPGVAACPFSAVPCSGCFCALSDTGSSATTGSSRRGGSFRRR